MSLRALAVACAVLGLAVAGCGSSESQFVKDFKKQKDQLGKIGGDLAQAAAGASSQTNAQIAAEFTTIADRVRAVEGSLATLKPPAKAAASYTAYRAAVAKAEADTRAVAAAAKSGNTAAAKSSIQSLAADGPAIKKTGDQVVKNG
jgi:hypothetical protein